MRRFVRPAARRGAFTLMETLLATALLAALLTAAVMLVFQVTSLWATQSDDAILDRHVDGVDRFVRRLFAESGVSRIVTPTTEQVANEHALVAMSGAGGDAPWVGAFATAGGAVECRLGHDGDGRLLLYWNTADEKSLNRTAAHRQVLSPWVEEATLYRLESGAREWVPFVPGETAAGGGRGRYALTLKFAHAGRRRSLMLLLPDTEGLP